MSGRTELCLAPSTADLTRQWQLLPVSFCLLTIWHWSHLASCFKGNSLPGTGENSDLVLKNLPIIPMGEQNLIHTPHFLVPIPPYPPYSLLLLPRYNPIWHFLLTLLRNHSGLGPFLLPCREPKQQLSWVSFSNSRTAEPSCWAAFVPVSHYHEERPSLTQRSAIGLSVSKEFSGLSWKCHTWGSVDRMPFKWKYLKSPCSHPENLPSFGSFSASSHDVSCWPLSSYWSQRTPWLVSQA